MTRRLKPSGAGIQKSDPTLAVVLKSQCHLPISAIPNWCLSAFNADFQRTEVPMSTITTKDGVEIFYKDWGKGQPIVFSHGWPLSADDWDTQMMFFVKHGYRVI